MKKLALTSIALLAFSAIWAQSTSTADTTSFPLGDTEIIIINKNTPKPDSIPAENAFPDDDDCDNKDALTHWAGLDLGMNFLLNSNNNTDLAAKDEWLELDPARSLSWRLNIYEEKIRIVKDYVGLVTGLGFTWNSYSFNNNVSLTSNADSTFGVIDSIPEYSKNKLRASYVNVPLMVEFNTSSDPKRTFHVSAGVIGGLRIGTVNRQKFDLDGQEYDIKVRDDFNFSPVTLDATARIGYRNFTLWATYGLTPLFKDSRGPEVYPVSVGLTIIPFG